jgi:hypothetical protein
MKKRITGFMLCLTVLIWSGCESLFDEQEKDAIKTRVRFVNTNDFSVSLYSDSLRRTKIADSEAHRLSDWAEVESNSDEVVVYPTYHIVFDGASVPYEGKAIVDRIDPGKTTAITVPFLKELGEGELGKSLSNTAYLKLQNDGGSSLILLRGSSEMRPEGLNSAILNGGETGVYIISPGSVSNYSLRLNTISRVDFPQTMTEFTANRFYSLCFDGSDLILVAEKQMTIAQAIASLPYNGSEAKPFPLTENNWIYGSIAPHEKEIWYLFDVIKGTKYTIWWFDRKNSNYETLYIEVRALYSGGGHIFVMDGGGGSFTANASGTVKIQVTPYTSGNTGTYAIVYDNGTGNRPYHWNPEYDWILEMPY